VVELPAVLKTARDFLSTLTEAQAVKRSRYMGSMERLRGESITSNYLLARQVAHVYYHIADITAVRASLGHQVSDFPGPLAATLAADKEI